MRSTSENADIFTARDEIYFVFAVKKEIFFLFYTQRKYRNLNLTFYLVVSRSSPVENKNDLELDFKVFFFTDSCCSDIVHDESN